MTCNVHIEKKKKVLNLLKMRAIKKHVKNTR